MGVNAFGLSRKMDQYIIELVCGELPLVCKILQREVETSDLSLNDDRSF